MKIKYFLAFVLLVAVVGSYFRGYTPIAFSLFFLVMSAITFVVYARDKKAAKQGEWRVSENTLHLLALLGGWPGAMIAQEKLRHKTRKTSFLVVFWITFFINGLGFAWLHSSVGQEKLRPALLEWRIAAVNQIDSPGIETLMRLRAPGSRM